MNSIVTRIMNSIGYSFSSSSSDEYPPSACPYPPPSVSASNSSVSELTKEDKLSAGAVAQPRKLASYNIATRDGGTEDEENKTSAKKCWGHLPDIPLLRIMSYLTPEDQASLAATTKTHLAVFKGHWRAVISNIKKRYFAGEHDSFQQQTERDFSDFSVVKDIFTRNQIPGLCFDSSGSSLDYAALLLHLASNTKLFTSYLYTLSNVIQEYDEYYDTDSWMNNFGSMGASKRCVELPGGKKATLEPGMGDRIFIKDMDKAASVSPSPVRLLTGHDGEVTCLAAVSDKLLASADSEGDLILWDIHNGDRVYHIQNAHNDSVRHLLRLPDGRLMSTGYASRTRTYSNDFEIKTWLIDHLANTASLASTFLTETIEYLDVNPPDQLYIGFLDRFELEVWSLYQPDEEEYGGVSYRQDQYWSKGRLERFRRIEEDPEYQWAIASLSKKV